MANFQLSQYQQNIINHVCNSRNNLLVDAKAGSGKTSTALIAVKEFLHTNPRAEVIISAFNRSIANEIKVKMNGYTHVNVCTSHSLGLKAIRKYIRIKGENIPLVVNDKVLHFKLLYNLKDYSKIIDEETENNSKWDFINNVDKVLNLCRVNLIKADEVERINEIIETFGIVCVADEVSAVRKFLETAYELRVEKNVKEVYGRTTKIHPRAYVIDYCDMLTFGATHADFCESVDLFVGDECQDFNFAQHNLIFNSLSENGKWLLIGDPKQAINGFCGAMNDSFDRLAEVPNTDMLPLSVNYRCGKEIIAKAQEIVCDIEAHENAIDGEVNEVTDLAKIQPKDFILCRTKAPLVRIAMNLIKNNKTAFVLGKDIANGLKALIRQTKLRNSDSTTLLMDKLNEILEATKTEVINKGYKGDLEENPTLIELTDKVACLDAISLPCTNISETLDRIATLFSEDAKANAILCMTAHKSKGLEADNVFIVLPNKLPLTWKGQLDWQFQQEKNLEYVAYTRAKKSLNIVTNEDLGGMDVE